MIESLRHSYDLVTQFYRDGFIAAVAVAIAGGLVGLRLGLRRLPLAGLAAPKLAALGLAAAFILFAEGEADLPGELPRILCSAGTVILGMAAIAALGRGRASTAAFAGLLFVAAGAGASLLAAIAPQREVSEYLAAEGRLLTVSAADRNVVVGASGAVALVMLFFRRAFDAAAFDPDFARVIGRPARRLFLAEIVVTSLFAALTVPRIGAPAVLAVLFIPPALIQPTAPSLGSAPWLVVLASILGILGSFHLAIALDLPPDAALVLGVLGASLLVAATSRLVGTRR
ncbi:MAG: metal ABC transporter permease [Planctomycetes bacterium]|nr:metal ABC transporter permease [Planctomycetota bacterium]